MTTLSIGGALVVVALTLNSGCTTARGAWIGTGVGVGVVGLGAILFAVPPNSLGGGGCGDKGDCRTGFAGAALIGVGGAYAMLSLANLIVLGEREAENEVHARKLAEAQAQAVRDAFAHARDDALALTSASATASRSGDCDTVRRLEPKVLALDFEVHSTVFLVDVAIKRCLAAPTRAIVPALDPANVHSDTLHMRPVSVGDPGPQP